MDTCHSIASNRQDYLPKSLLLHNILLLKKSRTQIKSHLQGQATAILALTASTLEEEKTMVLSAGCDDFVRKPFQEEIIFEKMAQYLGVRYVYEDIQVKGLSEAIKLTPESLAVMPSEWLRELSEAAVVINTEQIAQLLSQIPKEHQSLAQAIQEYVDNFDFDLILNFAQTAIKG